MGGAQKKKAIKFIKKGNLNKKIKQRNIKKKIQSIREKKKTKFEIDDGTNDRKKKVIEEATATACSIKKDSDMMDDMNVDEFLNGKYFESEDESELESMENKEDESSSEEEDEDALDPRYMTSFPDLEEEEEQEQEVEEQDEDKSVEEQEETSMGRVTLTMSMLIEAEKHCFDHYTANGLRRMMKMFSDACRTNEEIQYEIQSSSVYNRLMLQVFGRFHPILNKLIIKDDKIDHQQWKKYAFLIKRFFTSVRMLLTETTEKDIHTFVLRQLSHYLIFLLPDVKTAHRMLRALLKIWGKSLDHNVCMLAFLRIRDLSLQMPFPFLEAALKGSYMTYTRNTKFTNEMTLSHHILLGNCMVELYGIDMASSYQHAFVYIRELAMTIRKTIISPSPETFKSVLNWQFFNQLRIWSAIISTYPLENQLHSLLYPLCQLIYAVVRLASTIRYAPMRFQCVTLLQQLANSSQTFIPTSSILLEILHQSPYTSPSKSTKGSSNMDVDLKLCVKLSKAQVDQKRIHDVLFIRLIELLQSEMELYRYHIGFPEFSIPIIITLTRFLHHCHIPKWKTLVRGLLEQMNKQGEWIRRQRNGIDACPKDQQAIHEFLQHERNNGIKLFKTKHMDTFKQPDKPQEIKTQEREEKRKSLYKGVKQEVTVDDETFAKVKKMNLKEFQKAVEAVDENDVVQDIIFSSDDEE